MQFRVGRGPCLGLTAAAAPACCHLSALLRPRRPHSPWRATSAAYSTSATTRAQTVRIVLVTQMWPTSDDPALGSFLVPLVRELRAAGHEVTVCAIERRGGPPTKYVRLAIAAIAATRRTRPDVVFAHFL